MKWQTDSWIFRGVSFALLTILVLLSIQPALAAGGPVAALVSDISPATTSSNPNGLFQLQGNLYFVAWDAAHGNELWRSDGTPAGAWMVADIYPGPTSSNPSNPYNTPSFAILGNQMYFNASDPQHGSELWVSDGTTAGTKLVADLRPGIDGSFPSWMTTFNGRLYFTANNGTHGNELWTSDGTAAGTFLLADIYPGSLGSDPGGSGWAIMGNKLYFPAVDQAHGQEMWMTDGTAAGTTIMADIRPGADSSYPRSATRLGNKLYFSANDWTHGNELWISDGTAAGTRLVKDINTQVPASEPQTTASSEPLYPVVFNGALYFTANDGIHGTELWRSSGTAATTTLVRDVGSGDTRPQDLVPMGNRLYFAANDGVHGIELWRTNGTASGTGMVADINPGAMGSWAEAGGFIGYSVYDGTLYFLADDGAHGVEPWTSRGTASTTRMLGDIYPGRPGSQALYFTAASGAMFFAATDPEHGRELYKAERGPDLSVAKSNTVGGTVPAGSPWSWRLEIANNSIAAPATFSAGQVVLTDSLPLGPVYPTTATVIPLAGNTTGTLTCTIASRVLTCKAASGGVTIGGSSRFEVLIVGITAQPGTYTNPRSGALCSVDPQRKISETNEANNSCNKDAVTVTAPPPPTATP